MCVRNDETRHVQRVIYRITCILKSNNQKITGVFPVLGPPGSLIFQPLFREGGLLQGGDLIQEILYSCVTPFGLILFL